MYTGMFYFRDETCFHLTMSAIVSINSSNRLIFFSDLFIIYLCFIEVFSEGFRFRKILEFLFGTYRWGLVFVWEVGLRCLPIEFFISRAQVKGVYGVLSLCAEELSQHG